MVRASSYEIVEPPPLGQLRLLGEIGNLLPNNRRQRRTGYALCHILYPVSAAHTSIFRMDSNSTSYRLLGWDCRVCTRTRPEGKLYARIRAIHWTKLRTKTNLSFSQTWPSFQNPPPPSLGLCPGPICPEVPDPCIARHPRAQPHMNMGASLTCTGVHVRLVGPTLVVVLGGGAASYLFKKQPPP